MSVLTPPGAEVCTKQYVHCKPSISSLFMLIIVLLLELKHSGKFTAMDHNVLKLIHHTWVLL